MLRTFCAIYIFGISYKSYFLNLKNDFMYLKNHVQFSVPETRLSLDRMSLSNNPDDIVCNINTLLKLLLNHMSYATITIFQTTICEQNLITPCLRFIWDMWGIILCICFHFMPLLYFDFHIYLQVHSWFDLPYKYFTQFDLLEMTSYALGVYR